MKKLLMISIILVVVVLLLSLIRFGPTLKGFMQGDGISVLGAGSALIVIWALVIGFSITAIGTTFELSNLPFKWKIKLLRHHIPKRIVHFIFLSLIAGIIPFFSILNTDTTVNVYKSTVTLWLLLGFILQILLIISAVYAAIQIYDDLTLIPAMKATLKRIDDKKLRKLINLHNETLQQDIEKREHFNLIPMSGFISSFDCEGLKNHDELLTVFITLFREHDPQLLDSGVRAISVE